MLETPFDKHCTYKVKRKILLKCTSSIFDLRALQEMIWLYKNCLFTYITESFFTLLIFEHTSKWVLNILTSFILISHLNCKTSNQFSSPVLLMHHLLKLITGKKLSPVTDINCSKNSSFAVVQQNCNSKKNPVICS